MLTASKNLLQEDWVQCWLDKLTPKQKTLVIEVLEDFNKYRKPLNVNQGREDLASLLSEVCSLQ